MTTILGISARYHDSAAALLADGQVVAASEEERFSRVKHDSSMPVQAIGYCLKEARLDPADLDTVVFYEKPLRRFERLLETWLTFAPRGYRAFQRALPVWLHDKLHLEREIDAALKGRFQGDLFWINHHEGHAASAFYPSPFESAAILTLDGVGEWDTGAYGRGEGNRLQLTHETRFPHSLGLLYSAFTAYLGFRVNDGEYKVMGLAPYGEPRYADPILDQVLDLREDGSFHLDQSFFSYCHGLNMTAQRLNRLLGGPPRTLGDPLTQRHMDLAASIQAVTEEVILRCALHLHRETGERYLVLAGGVALNCVANGRILREGPYEDLWIQPAAGDSGCALGAALFAWHQLADQPRVVPSAAQGGSLLGPSWSDEEIRLALEGERIPFEELPDEESMVGEVAERLAAGQVIGWFQGRMEFGPRALGGRSILGDPRLPDMQATINRKIKYRESFRPFAPAVLARECDRYFGLDRPSPYMLLVVPVASEQRIADSPDSLSGPDLLNRRNSTIPAVTHVNGSARVQTVDETDNSRFRKLLEAFEERTGCPLLVNTSFNVRGEPIVCTPMDAYRCFLRTRMDAVVIGRCLLERDSQRALVLGNRSAGVENRGASRSAPIERQPWGREWVADFLCCERCGGSLNRGDTEVECSNCDRTLAIDSVGVLDFLKSDTEGESSSKETYVRDADAQDIGEMVRRFYEENPFPNYDGFESVGDLARRASRSAYAAALDRQLPIGARVLEIGCGTGQLGAFLSMGGRAVVGVDFSRASLQLGAKFCRSQDLRDFQLLRADLFKLPLKPGSFDLVVCKGVLHHTSDPRLGLEKISQLVRPGGHLIVGLYHRWARLPTVLRSLIYRLTGGRQRSADYVMRHLVQSEAKAKSWWLDQYFHPHESRHGAAEVVGWLQDLGLEITSSVPPIWLGESFSERAPLFGPPRAPSRSLELLLVQLGWLFTISREGALFDLIARKPP